MFDTFDTKKATQGAALLLCAHGGSIAPGRLLHLLYLADRTSLRETGWPIVGHQVVAAEDGPLHAAVDDLVSGRQIDAIWSGSIRSDRGSLHLTHDPGRGQLSEHGLQVFNSVVAQFRGESDAELTDYVKSLPEWRKNHLPNLRQPIPYRDIVSSLDFSAADVEEILEQIEETRMIEAIHEELRHSTVQ